MYYTDEKRTYRRVVGGIAWPGNSPGFGVVVGEDMTPPVGVKDPYLYLLGEVEGPDVHTLFKRCVELAVKYHASCFYGRYDQAMVNSLNLWNRNAREQGTGVLSFDSALFSKEGEISYHLNAIRGLLLPERKMLHLTDVVESPQLPAYIQALPPNIYATATDIEYPAVAALGYAVTLLVEFRTDYEEDEEERNIDNIDPITGY